MIKNILHLLRYRYFFFIENKIFPFILSLKNQIFFSKKIIGIYDLKYRDLSYDIVEFLLFLKIQKKLLNKNKISIYIYSVNKFKKNEQFYSFFLEILKSFDVDFKLIDKSFFFKYNNFKFNTFFLDDTVDSLFNDWDKLEIEEFKNLNITKLNLNYEDLINEWLVKNNIFKNKLVTITIRNNPFSTEHNTEKNFIIDLYNFLKDKNYHPVLINDNLNPLKIEEKNILQINSNSFLYRAEFYKIAKLNMSNSRGAGNIINLIPTNWYIFNFSGLGKKRYEFLKKINEARGKFCHIDNNFNNINIIKKNILNILD